MVLQYRAPLRSTSSVFLFTLYVRQSVRMSSSALRTLRCTWMSILIPTVCLQLVRSARFLFVHCYDCIHYLTVSTDHSDPITTGVVFRYPVNIGTSAFFL